MLWYSGGMENPLLKYKNDTNDSYIRFDLIKDEHFEPAFEVALATAKENLQKIIENPEAPTFENTIEALEYVSEDLDRITSIFGNLKEANRSEEIDRVANLFLPRLSEFENDIVLSKSLFEKVKNIYDSKPTLKTKEQQRLLDKSYEGFVRNGALLSDIDKVTLRQYDNDLSLLTQKFGENLLSATNAYELHIVNESDLSGLPDRVKVMAHEEANARGKDGWIFTLQAPSIGPFMQYADNAELRREVSIASGSRAMKGEYDNRQVVLDILKLRKKHANILGYPSHAHFVLEDRMAKTPENIEDFFSKLFEVAKPLAKKDFESLCAYKKKFSNEALNPWDVSYYEEKIKKENFDFDEEVLRPYFELDSVIGGLFEHVRLLYGLVFSERKDIPVYHNEVKVFQVKKETGEHVGLLYLDLFPRESKAGGGWIDALRVQQKKNNIDTRAQLLIVCNFTKPEIGASALLSFSEVETLFHEVGHGLHDLLSECMYPSLSGTNVYRDFVELPSQLLDSWVGEKESLLLFAKHYKTNEPISDELIKKMNLNKNFFSAWTMLGQLRGSVIDKRIHEESSDIITDIEEFESIVGKPYSFFEHTSGTSLCTIFKHIFNSGYDVGYYSYHWAEVLAADAFEYFKEEGLFSKEIAEKFRANILSKGNTEEPLDLYRAFRGRDADPKALFRHKGLI